MFYDLNDNIKTNFRFAIDSGGIKPMQLKIDCVAGKTWKCSAAPNLTIEAKHEGDVSWVDLESTGIDLTSWDGNREIFDVRFTADSVLSYNLDDFYFYFQ